MVPIMMYYLFWQYKLEEKVTKPVPGPQTPSGRVVAMFIHFHVHRTQISA
jgi:hypothetical protein